MTKHKERTGVPCEHKYISILKLGTLVMLVFLASCTHTKYIPNLKPKPSIKSFYLCFYGITSFPFYYPPDKINCKEYDYNADRRCDLYDYQNWLNRISTVVPSNHD